MVILLQAIGARFFRHFLKRRVDFKDDVLELLEFLRGFVFSHDRGNDVATQFIGNGHGADIVLCACYGGVNSVLIKHTAAEKKLVTRRRGGRREFLISAFAWADGGPVIEQVSMSRLQCVC